MKTTVYLTIFLALIVGLFFTSIDQATLINLEKQNLPPSYHHLFGCDDLGRDLLARSIYALKISLLIGILATLIDMVLGSLIGILAALVSPFYRSIIARFLDIMTILPQMLLSLLILTIFKNGFFSLVISISLTGWIPTARAIRAEMLKLKTMDFIKSLQGFGFSYGTILKKHLFPACLPTLLVSSALCLPQAIFSEAFMSFLGLGITPPTPSLGNMIADGLSALSYYPWRFFFPAACVFFLILSLQNLTEKLKKNLGLFT